MHRFFFSAAFLLSASFFFLAYLSQKSDLAKKKKSKIFTRKFPRFLGYFHKERRHFGEQKKKNEKTKTKNNVSAS